MFRFLHLGDLHLDSPFAGFAAQDAAARRARQYEALEELLRIEKVTALIPDNVSRAESYHDNVIPAMKALREYVDEMETLTASEYWPLPTYGDMMFKV